MLYNRIINFLSENGISFKQKDRTIHTKCPMCGVESDFSILKDNGYSICYRAKCSYGKRSFVGYVSAVLGIPEEEAKQKLFKGKFFKPQYQSESEFKFNFDGEEEQSEMTQYEWPEFGSFDIDSESSAEGLKYLEGRGISKDLAKKHGIRYSPFMQRVLIPIYVNGMCYGYQGRHISPDCPKSQRMRNNKGFRRELLVMFVDTASLYKHRIICEGPFDALKFNKIGGYVATMGLNVSKKQLSLILKGNPDKVYLALDEDAEAERKMEELNRDIPVDCYRVRVPKSCKDRCELIGKKADFGECTEDEIKTAIEGATLMPKSVFKFNF
jgi:DNA primase